jgi:hypothetical protein
VEISNVIIFLFIGDVKQIKARSAFREQPNVALIRGDTGR